MKQTIQAAPKDSVFRFEVTFQNLADEELGLLLFGLNLMPTLAHKIGGGKPLGAGSVKIMVKRFSRYRPEDRYRRRGGREDLTGEPLYEAIRILTKKWREDESETMQALRSLMHFDPQDPKVFSYPSREWFDRNSEVPLRSWQEFREKKK